MQANDLIAAIHRAGLRARPYSGRKMYGKTCVAAELATMADLSLLGPGLRDGLEVDELGLGWVAYWPDTLLLTAHESLARQDH